MNTDTPKNTRIDINILKEKCSLPDLLRRIGLGKHAKPSCPSPFRSDSKPSWGIFQRDGHWYFKDFATDERLTNMSQVHEAILSERLQKELIELQWAGDKALAAVDVLVATDGLVAAEGAAPQWNLQLTLPRCVKAMGGETPDNHNVCERLFQSVLFERIQGQREWKFANQAIADLFIARWLDGQLAKTPGKCDAIDAPASLLQEKDHREVATYLVSRPNGARCLNQVAHALCTANGGANGLAQQLSRGLPVGVARIDTITTAKDVEAARGDKADACVNQVLGQLRK